MLLAYCYAHPLPSWLIHSASPWLQFSHTLFSDTASLVGSSLFSSPHQLEGNEISPGIQVVIGPVDMTSISSVPSFDDPLFTHPRGHNFPKCRPSRMLPDYEPPPVQAGVLVSSTQTLDLGNAFSTDDVPEFSTKFYTTVVVKSTKDHTVLPHNANSGSIQPLSSNHDQAFSEAADHTAHQLADTWLEYAKRTGSVFDSKSVSKSQAQPSGTSSPLRSWSLPAQTTEMAQAGSDSSFLSPFLPELDLDPPHVFPPAESVDLDPHSEEYFQKLVPALDLDTDIYAHLNPVIMKQFKELIRKYSHSFHLPGSPLGTIKGYYHHIATGDSPPVYRLPYRKSPSELAAIKDELHKMLKLHIIRPSFSSWGAPCVLVRKPLEKGLPQPPRFVVDYRGLNTVTAGDGYPIPSVSNVLDAPSGGNKFAKLDLASGYWQVLVNPDHVRKTAFSTHLGHPYDRIDLLTLKDLSTGHVLPHPVNVDKCCCYS